MTDELQGYTFSFPLFTFPLDAQKELKRIEVIVTPKPYTSMRALADLRELLMHVEDYELVRKVCGVEGKGLEDLFRGIQTGIPRAFDVQKPEEYEAFLARLERLSLVYIIHGLSSYDQYISLFHANGPSHPQSLLVYALAVGALNDEAHSIAQSILEFYHFYRVDIAELSWVRSRLLSYQRYGGV
jgi:hypothetical protein